MNFSLFQALGPEHPSPQIYILDFPSDLRAAFYLMLGGYYRPAILSLRNWLEMRLLGIYFGRVEHNRKNYHDWKQGKFMAPFGPLHAMGSSEHNHAWSSQTALRISQSFKSSVLKDRS